MTRSPRYAPSEIICNHSFHVSGIDVEDFRTRLGISVYSLDSWYFDDELCKKALMDHFHMSTLSGLGLDDFDCGVIAAGALLQYLIETQKTSISNLTKLTPYITGKFMLIDSSDQPQPGALRDLTWKNRNVAPCYGCWIRPRRAMGARYAAQFYRAAFDRSGRDLRSGSRRYQNCNQNAIAREKRSGNT